MRNLEGFDLLDLKRGLKGMSRMIAVLLGMIGSLLRFPEGPLGGVLVRGVLEVSAGRI